jgi:hypothetical protein
MARTLTEEITGWGHCTNPRCEGHAQTEIPVFKDTVEHTYADSGGDLPGVEKSQVYYRPVNDEDATCPVCEGQRDVTGQKRPVIMPLSGHDQAGLLQYKPPEVPV